MRPSHLRRAEGHNLMVPIYISNRYGDYQQMTLFLSKVRSAGFCRCWQTGTKGEAGENPFATYERTEIAR